MKHTLLIAGFLFVCIIGFAQTGTGSSSGKTTAAPKVMTTVTPTSFESSLVSGNLSFIKMFKQGDGKDFVPVYSLAKNNDASFNNRKPIQVSLSRQSFDSVFTKTSSDMAAKWGVLNKYIESNRILLTEEKGWVNVISYFNGL